MTIINPNSIAGITSVTAEAGVMNFYKSDGTLAGLQLNGVNFNTTSGISTFNNVYVGGTITYEDVKNVDSVGIITARAGIKVPDDQRIQVGTSNDLDIYHTTSGTSWIRHGNTSEYFVIEGDQMDFRSYTNSHYRVRMGTAVELRHNNIERLKTTSTGVDVTGAITADDLRTDNSQTFYLTTANDFRFRHTGGSERLRIDSSGSLLIGGTSSSGATEKLRIENDSATSDVCQVTIISGNAERAILNFGDAQDHNIGRVTYDNTDNHMSLWTDNTERLRITSDGQVNIATTANYGTIGTAAAFQIYGSNAGGNVSQNIINHASANASSTCDINIWQNYRLANRIVFGRENNTNWQASASGAASYTAFYTNNAGTVAERLRIDSAGNIGINIIPDTQGNTTDSIQLGTATNLYNESSDDYTILANNAYYDGTNNKYIKTQESSRLMQAAGNLWFQQAASGSADATITYTTPLLINSLGIIKQTNAGNTQDGTYYSSITIDNTGSNTWSRLRLDRGGVARWGLSLRNDDKFSISNLYTNGSVGSPDDDCFVVHNNSKITMSGFLEASGGAATGHGAKLGNLSVGYDSLYNTIQALANSTNLHLQYNVNGDIQCNEGGGDMITADVRPRTNNAFNLGTNSYRWANIHTNDLNLSNEGNVNDVDGTWGKYTIQEGENDLYLINRRNGKKYKFLLKEVD